MRSTASDAINPMRIEREDIYSAPLANLATPRTLQPLEMLEAMRACACSDARDRIYTAQVFGLLKQPEIYLHPDYSKSTKAVYVDWTVNYVRVLKDLDVLHYAGSRVLQGLPSWVPDWTRPIYSVWIPHLRASGAARAVISQINDSFLEVKGVQVAKIRCVAQWPPSWAEVRGTEMLKVVLEVAANFVPIAINDHAQVVRLCRVLACNSFQDTYIGYPRSRGHLDHCIILAQNFLGANRSMLSDEDFWYARHSLVKYAPGRHIYKSSDGRLGMGPVGIQPEDVVVILLGVDCAMILRPMDGGSYQVIGPAYFEDYMDGEAILGPLPERFQPVRTEYYPYRTNGPAFRDVEIDEIQLEDPRLPPLPIEWERRTCEVTGRTEYRHSRTGEERDHIFDDPRCDEEALIARGVALENFTLA